MAEFNQLLSFVALQHCSGYQSASKGSQFPYKTGQAAQAFKHHTTGLPAALQSAEVPSKPWTIYCYWKEWNLKAYQAPLQRP